MKHCHTVQSFIRYDRYGSDNGSYNNDIYNADYYKDVSNTAGSRNHNHHFTFEEENGH